VFLAYKQWCTIADGPIVSNQLILDLNFAYLATNLPNLFSPCFSGLNQSLRKNISRLCADAAFRKQDLKLRKDNQTIRFCDMFQIRYLLEHGGEFPLESSNMDWEWIIITQLENQSDAGNLLFCFEQHMSWLNASRYVLSGHNIVKSILSDTFDEIGLDHSHICSHIFCDTHNKVFKEFWLVLVGLFENNYIRCDWETPPSAAKNKLNLLYRQCILLNGHIELVTLLDKYGFFVLTLEEQSYQNQTHKRMRPYY